MPSKNEIPSQPQSPADRPPLPPELAQCQAELRAMQAQLELAQRRHHELYELAPVGYLNLDQQGVIRQANRSAAALLQATPEALREQPLRRFVHPDSQAAYEQHHTALWTTGTMQSCELQLSPSAGATFWVQWTGRPSGAGPEARDICIAFTDLSARKDTEHRLQQLNRLYAVLGAINQLMVREKSPAAMLAAACRVAVEMGQLRMAWIGLLDGPTRRVDVVAAAGEVAGYLEALQPELQDSTRRPGPTAQAILSGEHIIFNDVATDPRFAPWRAAALQRDYRACGIFPFRVGSRIAGSINLYASEAGFFNAAEVELLDKLAMDIGFALEVCEQEAARQRIEQALVREHARVRQIIDSQFGFVGIFSLEGVVLEINQSPLTLTGLTRNQVLGRRFWEVGWLAPEAEAPCQAAIANASRGETWRGDVRCRFTGMGLRDVDTVFSPLRNAAQEVVNVVGFGVDVTERNQVAAALRENQRFLATLVSNLPGLVYRCCNDAQWTMTFVSAGCRELTGYDPSELEQNRVAAYGDLVHPEDRDALWEKCQAALTARTPCDNEYRIRTKSGATRWVWERAMGNYAADGALLSIEGFVQDITNRKQAEQSLAASQERLRTIIETEPECVKLVDPKGELLEMNPAGLAMLEAESLEQVKAQGLSAFILPPYRAAFGELHRRVMGGASDLLEFEVCGLRGTQRWLETHATPMRDKGGAVTSLLGITRDVTRRKQAEAALRTAEQWAATGRLAAGIAHEINNPLAGIRSAFAIVKAAVPAAHEDLRFAQMIEREIERISRIVGQMFHLYKPQAEPQQEVEFNALLREVAELSQAQAAAKAVRLLVADQPEPIRAWHPPGALSQVLLNLVRNAVQATPTGTAVRLVVAPFHEQVIVTVADEGPGIPDELRERVFEPFFSTKSDQPDSGMGLGLSVSRSLVEMMGGHLELVSTPTGETTFCMTLPRNMAPVDSAQSGSAGTAARGMRPPN